MTGKLSDEQLRLVIEDAGWDIDRPLREQLAGEDPPAEPTEPAEPPSPGRELADAVAAAQSKWYDGRA